MDENTLKHCRILRISRNTLQSFRPQIVKFRIPLISLPYFMSHPKLIKGFTVLDHRLSEEYLDSLVFSLDFEANPNFPKIEVLEISSLSFGNDIMIASTPGSSPSSILPPGSVPESSSPVMVVPYLPETKFCKIARVSETLITDKYNYTLSSNNLAKIGNLLVHKELSKGYKLVKILKDSKQWYYDFVVFSPEFDNPLEILIIEELNIS